MYWAGNGKNEGLLNVTNDAGLNNINFGDEVDPDDASNDSDEYFVL